MTPATSWKPRSWAPIPEPNIALLKVDGGEAFPAVALGHAEAKPGDWVIALGNPYGLEGTVTAGIVSALGRDIGMGSYDNFVQIDAPVNCGNSGGPTFNQAGEVIGVNTAIFSPTGGSIGIGFAIPARLVESVVAQLKEKGTCDPRLARRPGPAGDPRACGRSWPQAGARRAGVDPSAGRPRRRGRDVAATSS